MSEDSNNEETFAKETKFTDSGKEISEETITKAINVLEAALTVYEKKKRNSFKLFDKLRERRSGKERRKDLLAPYYRAFVKKMLENFSSAKMLIFFLPLWTSVFFLWVLFGMRKDFLDFAIKHPTAINDVLGFFKIAMEGFISWCTFTVSLGGTVIVVRETFKVSKLKALTEESEKMAMDDKIVDMQD